MITITRKALATMAIAALIILPGATLRAGAQPGAGTPEQVPFKGDARGTITGVLPGPGGITLSGVAVGHATHLGRFTREEQIVLDPLTGAFTGTIVFTAADRDQIHCTLAGQFTSLTDAAGTYTITGGTGRFEGAAGGADFVASLPDGVHFTAAFNGTLEK